MAKDDDLIKNMNEALTSDIEMILKKVLSVQLKPVTERLLIIGLTLWRKNKKSKLEV
jgi:hypothetical protein